MKSGERQIGRDARRSTWPARMTTTVIHHQSSLVNPKGFTLIELLVVVAVIALLMAILLPALQRARRQGKAMICQSRLKQWGHILAIYTEENDGCFPYGPAVAAVWFIRGPMPLEDGDSTVPPFTQPVPTDGIRCCPTAVRPPVHNGFAGLGSKSGPKGAYYHVTLLAALTRFEAYRVIEPVPAFTASYGFNGWLFENTNTLSRDQGARPVRLARNVLSIQRRPAVPVLLDAACPDAYVSSGDRPLEEEEGSISSNNMLSFCRNRHDGYVNGLFLDWSVRKIGLKELWTLKWDKDFDTRGKWTIAGGVGPEDWPEWMRRFRDY